jgi:hypothetical protein
LAKLRLDSPGKSVLKSDYRRLAELLLDDGHPESEGDEYVQECESGNRGVGISSAEPRLFLPGHLYWDDE